MVSKECISFQDADRWCRRRPVAVARVVVEVGLYRRLLRIRSSEGFRGISSISQSPIYRNKVEQTPKPLYTSVEITS